MSDTLSSFSFPTAPPAERLLTSREFQGLADVPPEIEWFANIANPRTRRAYVMGVRAFVRFLGIAGSGEFRQVSRAHVIAWRKSLEQAGKAPATVRRQLSAVASLFDYLCERNAVADNPVRGVERPLANANEGKTPAIGDAQASRRCGHRHEDAGNDRCRPAGADPPD